MERAARESLSRICPKPRKVLLLPPDVSRAHSGAGWITRDLYRFYSQNADVYVMPTLGQHLPHTPEQNRWMFGAIPADRILVHDWKKDGNRLGTVPADYVRRITGGRADWDIPVKVNRRAVEENWDIIVNVGPVVPHEVLGFANHNKNYFIGLGGKEMICASHMAAACYGIENNLGTLVTRPRDQDPRQAGDKGAAIRFQQDFQGVGAEGAGEEVSLTDSTGPWSQPIQPLRCQR